METNLFGLPAEEEKLKPMTQKILDHLLRGIHITTPEAIMRYSCLQLPARIFELRQAGYNVVKEMRPFMGKIVAMYYIKEDEG